LLARGDAYAMPDATIWRGTLDSFGSEAAGKHVKKAGFVVQATADGVVWDTLSADTYRIFKRAGEIELRAVDDAGEAIDVTAYTDWQEEGNQAFRVTYTVTDNGSETTYTNEPLTLYEMVVYPLSAEMEPLSETEEIGIGAVTGRNIADATITAQQIANATITAQQIANATILGSNIANATITGANIANGTITGGNIQNASITGAQIANGTITATNIQNGTITANEIADATITGAKIANATILGSNIANATITGSNIANGTILGAHIASQTIAAANIQALTITANEIQDLTITAGKIVDATITGAKIAGATITDANIAANTITGAKIAAGTITAGNIAAGTITGGNIAAGTITAANLAANTITSQQLYLGVGGGIPYNVGEALLLAHFDGARPYESDYTGNVNGHRGQAAAVTGGVIYRPGMFGKGVQVAEATTNKILNPSAEATGNFTARGTATVTRDTGTYVIGATSYKIVLAAANDGINLTLSALANAIHYVSVWVTGSALTTLQASLDGTNWNALNTVIETLTDAAGNTWTRYGAQISAAQSNGSTTLRIRNSASSGTFYLDAAQVEQKSYPTSYADGSLGTGHSWSGTAHASQSSRTAALLTYPAAGNVSLQQGTLSYWVYVPGAFSTPQYDFGIRIDANNYLNVRHIFANNRVPIAASGSGGGGVDTSSGALTVSVGWHHIVVTWTAGALKLYVDGVQSGATANYVAPVGAPATIEIGSFNLQQQNNSILDEIAILPVVLSDTEIRAIYDSHAPLVASANTAEWRVANGAAEVWGNGNGIFARNANAVPSFALLNADNVNATTWGGASETFNSGDAMLGSNTSGKANLKYDAAAGRLNFRGGTTTQAYVDTNGSIVAGGGNVGMDANGYWVVPDSSAFTALRSYKFQNGATENGGTYASQSGTANLIRVISKAVSGLDSGVGIIAYGASGKTSSATLLAIHSDLVHQGQISVTCNTDGTADALVNAERTFLSGEFELNVTTVDLGSNVANPLTVGNYSYVRVDYSGGAFTIRGIAVTSDEKMLILVSYNNRNMTLNHEDATATAGQRIISPTGANITCKNAILMRDWTSSRWRVIAYA